MTLSSFLILVALVGGAAAAIAGAGSAILSDRELQMAKVEIAKATERAATLEKEAADARLETQRIKELVSWREFSAEQMANLTAVLHKAPSTVLIAYIANDPEALYIAVQLERAFIAAGWKVRLEGRIYSAHLWFGIYAPDNAVNAQIIREALIAGGVPFGVKSWQKADMWFSDSQEKMATVLAIGSKPRKDARPLATVP